MTTPIGCTKQYLVINNRQEAYRTRDLHDGILEAARNETVTVLDVTLPGMPWILKFDNDDEVLWKVIPDKALVDYAINELEESFDEKTESV